MNLPEFQKQVLENPLPVIVDLWAPWCGPCRAMQPALEQVSQKYAGQVQVVKVNVDESVDVAAQLDVMSIPTLVGFSGGAETMRLTGLRSAEALDILFDAVLHNRKPEIIPPAPFDRLVRSIAGLGLIAAGWFAAGHSWLLIVLGALVLFSAFYDRCPIFRAIYPRLKALFTKKTA